MPFETDDSIFCFAALIACSLACKTSRVFNKTLGREHMTCKKKTALRMQRIANFVETFVSLKDELESHCLLLKRFSFDYQTAFSGKVLKNDRDIRILLRRELFFLKKKENRELTRSSSQNLLFSFFSSFLSLARVTLDS